MINILKMVYHKDVTDIYQGVGPQMLALSNEEQF